jgi:hypothetical protein
MSICCEFTGLIGLNFLVLGSASKVVKNIFLIRHEKYNINLDRKVGM